MALSFRSLNPDEIKARNIFLQKELRDNNCPYAIEQEYPLVLGSQNFQYSYGLFEKSEPHRILAHANLLPRNIINHCGSIVDRIGLIGNVTSHPNYRNQGLIRDLLENLTELALKQNLSKLLLWSDLTSLYKKLDFVPFGLENRFLFTQKSFSEKKDLSSFLITPGDKFPSQLIPQILKIRYKTKLTVERSQIECSTLVKIPGTYIISSIKRGQMESFGIIGKGYDFMNRGEIIPKP